MKTSTEIITPAIAAQMLQQNVRNRAISRSTVESYKDQMLKEAWEQTGEAIKFSVSGRLIDGQHRLTALAELEGRIGSLPFLVVRELEDEAQKKMDRGKRRRVSDELTMDGVNQADVVVAASRTVLLVKTGGIFVSAHEARKIGYASEPDILAFVEANPGIVDFVSNNLSGVRKVYRKGGLMVGGLWLIAETGHDKFEDFALRLVTGSMLETNNPVLTLRERLATIQLERVSYSDKEILYFLFRAWLGFKDGVKLSKLQLPKGGVTKETWIDPSW